MARFQNPGDDAFLSAGPGQDRNRNLSRAQFEGLGEIDWGSDAHLYEIDAHAPAFEQPEEHAGEHDRGWPYYGDADSHTRDHMDTPMSGGRSKLEHSHTMPNCSSCKTPHDWYTAFGLGIGPN